METEAKEETERAYSWHEQGIARPQVQIQTSCMSTRRPAKAEKVWAEEDGSCPKRKKKVSIPSNAALATGPDGTRHLHELFLVHGGGDGVAQNTFSHRYAHERRERQRRRPSLFRAALTRSIPPGSPAILPITTH